jgi:hypothetical protein
MALKRCPSCKITKDLDDFHRHKNRADGHVSRCKTCCCGVAKKWREDNPERLYALTKKWAKENPDKVRKQGQRWAKENPDKVRAKDRRHYWKNPERASALKKLWREKNPEKVKEIIRKSNEKRSNTPQGRLNSRMSTGIRRSLKHGKQGQHWESLVGYTAEELKKHLEKQFKDEMTWAEFLAGEIHIDHKIPKAAFNFEKIQDDDFKRCWALDNLQPLWAVDNLKKQDNIDCHFQPRLVFKEKELKQ